jgi:uncharacterized protein (DUF302 family)
MLYAKEARGTVSQVVKRLEAAAKENKLGVLGAVNLKQKLTEKGIQFDAECQIIEVCNPAQAKRVLDSNMAISTALPCRISVYEEGGKVKIATLLPTAVLGLFGTPQIMPTAIEVEDAIVRTIDAACV